MTSTKTYYIHTVQHGKEVVDDFWTTRRTALEEVAKFQDRGIEAWIVVHEVAA